ncbi:PilZ domain-containing protein [Zavarzinia sp. CC-PAN008]|uniref:PilZ domain-containing protein n=1 Tax=Zavarzinia sp. CC-PAN008 TaxID=3243332 RepID=UPI003F744E6D
MAERGSITGPGTANRHADRRRERRYEVDLAGAAEFDGASWPAVISDLSPSGALISADAPFSTGQVIVLDVAEFGRIDSRIVHAGAGFFGLQFLKPHLHRDRLTDWLRQEVG